MFTTLIETVGSDALLEIVSPALTDGLHQKSQAILHDEIINLLTEDPTMLQTLLATTSLALDKPELTISLLERAIRLAKSPQTRSTLVALARKVGLGDRVRVPEVVDLESCTQDQKTALRQLRAMTDIYFEGVTHRGVALRLNTLVVAPSGAGKNFLITTLGRILGLPVLRLTVGDWIVTGAKSDPPTLETLRLHLDAHPRSLIHIDEIDKFRAVSDSAWSQGQLAELYSVLDRDVNYRSTKAPWTEKHTQRMKSGAMIIGSGTWHQVFASETAGRVGFLPTSSGFDLARSVRKAQIIPHELISRFSDRWISMNFYTEQDFVRLASSLGLAPEVLDPKAAAASGLNYRFVQNALTEHALKKRLAALDQPAEPVAQSEFDRPGDPVQP